MAELKYYRTIHAADVWGKPDPANHAGRIAGGEVVGIEWFWESGYGEIKEGNFLGKYVHQSDLGEATLPETPEPEPTGEERMEQYDENGILVRVWLPRN